MKLMVISSAPFFIKEGSYQAYSPYIKEMEIWARYSEIGFCCPILKIDDGSLISKVNFDVSRLFEAKEFNITTFPQIIKASWFSFYNFYELLRAMDWADHIHLRCPGNLGLLGCIAQIFFPGKQKTAKYAGNWDPNATQPWSYKLQKWILSNTFLTRNMQVLVYGEWQEQSRNIKPFFTASYSEADKTPVAVRNFDSGISVLFVGTLSSGKQPLYAIRIVEALHKKGIKITLSLYGHGEEKAVIENYIRNNSLQNTIFLKGNQPKETLQIAFMQSHFVMLPSLSEGWPKAIAEGMFWGCVPIASKVSCVPNMLDGGKRGILLDMDFENDVEQLSALISNPNQYRAMVANGMDWSRKYTTDLFEGEIKKILQP